MPRVQLTRGPMVAPLIGVTIRRCTEHDLEHLAWDGEYGDERPVIDAAFACTSEGSMVMLVAEDEQQLVGQVWIDLVGSPTAGYLWALRVRPAWQRRGIGARLIAAAEEVIASAGRAAVELEVDRDNIGARRFYDHLGYAYAGIAASGRLRYRRPL